VADWENPFEQRLAEAFEAGETAVCLGMLRHTELGLPAERPGPPYPWPTVTGPDRTWLIAYTSQEAMRVATGGAVEHARSTTLVELAAGWPDPRWGLAANPGPPVSFFLASGTVARLAVPSRAQARRAGPPPAPPVRQTVAPVDDLYSYPAGGATPRSPYCHHARDVAYIATPATLRDALIRSDEEGSLSGDGSLHV